MPRFRDPNDVQDIAMRVPWVILPETPVSMYEGPLMHDAKHERKGLLPEEEGGIREIAGDIYLCHLASLKTPDTAISQAALSRASATRGIPADGRRLLWLSHSILSSWHRLAPTRL